MPPRTTAPTVPTVVVPPNERLLSLRGYSIPKACLTPPQDAWLRSALTVKPESPPQYDMGNVAFPIYFESKDRIYMPRDWAIKTFGEPDRDTRSDGVSLREELRFTGELREEQKPVVAAYVGSDCNGLLCVPCGYGKTYMAIWLAMQLRKRFLVVVHKEFLMAQWQRELVRLVPGIRLGKVQGPACEIGPEFDGALVMIQTLCSRDYDANTFKDFGFAVFDECHHLGAEHFSRSLLRIQTKHMLGLSATPDRTDGLTKVFNWFLGPIVYRIKHREADESVKVIVYRFESADTAYTNVPTNYRGEVIRARLINQISEFKERTVYLASRLADFAKAGRKLLVLSDRREHLADFESELKKLDVTDIGYYVGGMKQDDLDKSEGRAVILGTFAMASEAMNIPALNTILLATPKSNIEQSVGRILREKKDARRFAPVILDVLDNQHQGCIGQYKKRKAYYKACGYKVHVLNFGQREVAAETVAAPAEEPPAATAGCLISD
uniref:Helicase ATP-binding domain-containing protein n=1 Tax=viral metagenome TaxID=1070528 RepID=A0A6C0DSQ2_9ZZZZ